MMHKKTILTTIALLSTLGFTALTPTMASDKTPIEIQRRKIQELDAKIAELETLSEEAHKKLSQINKLIDKYQAELATTIEKIEETYRLRLDTTSDLADASMEKTQKVEREAKALLEKTQKMERETKALLAEFGFSAKEIKKLNDAVNVSEEGNVGIGITEPKAKLEVAGHFIRTIAYTTGNGPSDGTDVGQIKSRVLTFNKAKADTKLRINYTDNLRVLGSSKSCRWEIRVDGHSCPEQPLVYDYYANSNDNTHRSRTVVGYCSGISAGSHTIGIWVSQINSGSDCYTGYSNSTWVIEVEEVN